MNDLEKRYFMETGKQPLQHGTYNEYLNAWHMVATDDFVSWLKSSLLAEEEENARLCKAMHMASITYGFVPFQ